MAKKVLVDSAIEAGERFVRQLDSDGVPVVAAFWLYSPQAENYQLFVALKSYEMDGPRKTYDKLRDSLLRVPLKDRVDWDDVSAISGSDYRVTSLSKLLRTGPGIYAARVTSCMIDNNTIDDALIYRTDPDSPHRAGKGPTSTGRAVKELPSRVRRKTRAVARGKSRR